MGTRRLMLAGSGAGIPGRSGAAAGGLIRVVGVVGVDCVGCVEVVVAGVLGLVGVPVCLVGIPARPSSGPA